MVDELLAPILQGEYSRALYGAEGRVPLQDLRIIWLNLLPRSSQRLLAKVGACKWEGKPPVQPFYFLQDMIANPIEAIWLSRVYPPAPRPSHTWIEVTHCANRRATEERRRNEGKPLMRWQHPPMWLYAYVSIHPPPSVLKSQ